MQDQIRLSIILIPEKENPQSDVLNMLSVREVTEFEFKGYPLKDELLNHIARRGFNLKPEDIMAGKFMGIIISRVEDDLSSLWMYLDFYKGSDEMIRAITLDGRMWVTLEVAKVIALEFGKQIIAISDSEIEIKQNKLFAIDHNTDMNSLGVEISEYLKEIEEKEEKLAIEREIQEAFEENKDRHRTLSYIFEDLFSDEVDDYCYDWFMIADFQDNLLNVEFYNPYYHKLEEIEAKYMDYKSSREKEGIIYVFGGTKGKYILSDEPLICECYRDEKDRFIPIYPIDGDIFKFVSELTTVIEADDIHKEIKETIKSRIDEIRKQPPRYLLRGVTLQGSFSRGPFYFDELEKAYIAGTSEYFDFNEYEVIDVATQERVYHKPKEEFEEFQEDQMKTRKEPDPDPHGIWDMMYPNKEEDEEIDYDNFFKDPE